MSIADSIVISGNKWIVNVGLEVGKFEAVVRARPTLIETKSTKIKDTLMIPLIVNIHSYERRANYYLALSSSRARIQFDELEVKYNVLAGIVMFKRSWFEDLYCYADITRHEWQGKESLRINWLYKA